MLFYPQLATGAMSQFPVTRQRRLRTVVNDMGNGWTWKKADPNGTVTEWTLGYSGLTGDEVGALEQFFGAAEGTLNAFTFLDPTSNLLAMTDEMNGGAWQAAPKLTVAGSAADPTGGTAGWHVTNTGAGPQAIEQTVAAPENYVYCLSAYARAARPTTVTLLIGAQRANQVLTATWSRITATAQGQGTAESITFGVELPAGAEIDLYGMQAEPQAAASTYQRSTDGGVYEGARLSEDRLTVTATDVNCYSCTVKIIHVNHL